MLTTGLADDQSQLPGEVKGVLHPGIHPLSASWTVNMRRIADEEDAPRAVVCNLAAVDPECRKPNWIGRDQAGRAPLGDDCLNLLKRRCRRALGTGGRQIRNDPIASGFNRKDDERAFSAPVNRSLGVRKRVTAKMQ